MDRSDRPACDDGPQYQRCIDHGVAVAAGRPGLEAGFADQPVGGRIGKYRPHIPVARHGGKESLLSLEDVSRPGQSLARKYGGLHATARGFGNMQRLGQHRFVAALPEAAGQCHRIAERPDTVLLAEIEHVSGGHG